ncbi:uncharacterized protein LOC134242123 [Saccostrea cucullata]|uniref:uncharacterized protein LOC134242123 n=1 Tax=Saccostrea cuccullata TaxID=36930 RepID=UPI002ED05CF5
MKLLSISNFLTLTFTIYNIKTQVLYPTENFIKDSVYSQIWAIEEGLTATLERLKEKENEFQEKEDTCIIKEKETEINTLKEENVKLKEVNDNSYEYFLNEICNRQPQLALAHRYECQLYYNCSARTSLGAWEPLSHLFECTYPYVFSVTTHQCKNYTEVDCGNRSLPVWECQYRRNKCKYGGRCVPCEHLYPPCIGKADGLWPWVAKYPSPYYTICKDERSISTGNCETDSEWNSEAFPYNGTCTSRFNIPTSYGGLLPSCAGKSDGSYKFSERCDAYYACNNGVARAVKCSSGFNFDANSGSCQYMANCT